MPKRSNPYVEDLVPQSKIHIGLKQFNNNEDRMQKVYEKTLQLLFKGARKLPEEPLESVKNADTVSPARKDCMKQLGISKNGTLIFSYVSTKQLHPVVRCECGSVGMEEQCGYCEAALCSVCHHRCERCDLSFCSKCSITGSEGTEICVSCYS